MEDTDGAPPFDFDGGFSGAPTTPHVVSRVLKVSSTYNLFKVARRKGGNCCYGFILINTIITTRGKLFLSTTMPTTPPSKFLQAVIFFNKSKTKTKITQRQQNPWSVESWVLRPPNWPPAVLQRRPLVLARLLRLPEPRLHGRPRPCAARARVRL